MGSKLQLSISARRFALTDERAILTVTCLAAFLFFNSFGSIGIALPRIQKQFGNSLSEIQWVVLMGVVTISSLSFCFGRAGGIVGQRRLYKIGVALYATGAGLGALSTSFIQLLAARAVMAVGLAMALPVSTAILAASFEQQRRGRVLGLFASAIAVGRMTGPAVGGLLLELGGWTSIFWMNCLVGLGVTMAVVVIFRGPGEQRKETFDFWGSLALLIGYPSLLIALTFGIKLGWTWAMSWFGLAISGLAAFFWIELHSKKPLVDIRMFKRPSLAVALGTIVLTHMIHTPITLSAPLYLQNVLGVSGMTSGFLLAVLPLSTAIASPLGGRLADRIKASTVAVVGLVFIVVGVGSYSRLAVDTEALAVAAVLTFLGVGIGLFTPANQKVAFAALGQEDYGVLAAMLSSFGTAAGTIGTTITVALMEMDGGGELWAEPAVYAEAQQFAFMWLALLGIAGVVGCLKLIPAQR
jgi:EmrB/QacA subfamily drug resistance transporter